MTTRKIITAVLVIAAVATAGYLFYLRRQRAGLSTPSLIGVTYGVSPFQDTLVPIVGQAKGWYRQEGLDVHFKILGWTQVMQALSAGQIDVAINNMSSVVVTHDQNPQIAYWYGLNPFDNGFALMIRPDGKMKTLQQIEETVKDPNLAIKLTAAQLKGKTVITTGDTDMEQGVAAAARRGGLDFKNDIHIIDLNPDEGLAAFLRGEGDAYIGGIPQRTRAEKEGMVAMLTGADLGPPPINGIVTTKAYATSHLEVLLKLLHVWFETVNYMNQNEASMDDGASIIINELNSRTGAEFTLSDFKKYWNNYEHYPASPQEVQKMILDPEGRNYWKARWDDCNHFFFDTVRTIPAPVDPSGTFLMSQAQAAYVKKYGSK